MTSVFTAVRHDAEFRREAGKSFAKGMVFVILFFALMFGWMFLRAEDTLLRWQDRFPAKTIGLPVASTPAAQMEPDIASGLSDADRITPPGDAPEQIETEKAAPVANTAAAVTSATPFGRYRKNVALMAGRAHIAVIFTDIGIAESFSKKLMDTLPADITLGFSPYAVKLDLLKAGADDKGFESWLMLPLEPANYPTADPGPMTVLSNASLDAITEHITRLITLADKGYPGFISNHNHGFSEEDIRTNPLMKTIAEKGFGFAEGRSEGGSFAQSYAAKNFIPYAQAGEWLRRNMGRGDIQAVLQRAEKLAQMNGSAILMVEATPLSAELMEEWIGKLPGRNIQLVPLSSLTE